jgi:hypothetical protein
MATLDPPLNLLRSQILACTSLNFGEIGWIAGASHRQSGPHFPENPPPPGNPAYEVDAIDVPHAPSRGADMAVLTEALRQSRDPRVKLVIFNGRIFSSYDHADGDPYTWRPYSGEDDHSKHAHIERTDSRRDDLRPWTIGIDMASFLAPFSVGDSGDHVKFVQYALYDLHEATRDHADPLSKPLYPGEPLSPTIPARFTEADGAAMKRLLKGGNGKDFGPLLAKRLVRALGAIDAPDRDVPVPGDGVTAEQARDIAADVVRNATVTLTPTAE